MATSRTLNKKKLRMATQLREMKDGRIPTHKLWTNLAQLAVDNLPRKVNASPSLHAIKENKVEMGL